MQQTPLSQGNAALRDKDYEAAIRHYKRALAENPELAALLQSNIELAKHRAAIANASTATRNIPTPEGDTPRAAIVAHVFYPELWATLENRLITITYPYDLFITTTPERLEEVEVAVLASFPKADIRVIENRGMDILPFLQLLPELHTLGYSAVCKIHTKKGDGDLADIWRDIMLDGVLSNTHTIADVVRALRDNEICIAGPSCLYQSAERLMYKNREAISNIAAELYPERKPLSDWGFFAGSMFWCAPASYLAFSEQAVRSIDLLTDQYERDGKLEHAWERAFGLIPAIEGVKVGLILKRSITGGDNILARCNYNDWIGQAHIGDVMRQFKILQDEIPLLIDSDAIDVSDYRQQLPFGNLEFDHYIHYLTEGTFSDIRPAPFFSPREYREKNIDVTRAHREPYIHFLRSGHSELRRLRTAPKIAAHAELVARLWRYNREKLTWKDSIDCKRSRSLVSVIIPCFGNSELTITCLKSIKNARCSTDFELIIVDNGSPSKELTNLKLALPTIGLTKLRLIENLENQNFAVGCNIGAVNARGNLLIFLNNDTAVVDGWLDELISPLKHENIGAVQPKLLYPDGTIQCVGIVFSEKSPLGYPIYSGEPDEGAHVNTARIYQAITAACIALRAVDFFKLRGFDPIFVNGQEDVDLCFRLKRDLGRESFYTPHSVVYHHESKTPSRGRYIRENRVAFIERWATKVVADDMQYYLADGRPPQDWKLDSQENQQLGIGIYRPLPTQRKPLTIKQAWDELLEATCLARLANAYSMHRTQVDGAFVSICMPAYNRAELITTAVRSALAQTHANFELLICDDGSEDKTVEVVRRLAKSDQRIKLIEAKHGGVSAARNHCLDIATGDFVFFLDSDNTWTSSFLRNMITFLIAGDLDSAYCGLRVLDDQGAVKRYLGRDFDWLDCLQDNYVDINVFGHRRIPHTPTRFDEGLKRLVDWDYILGVTARRSCTFIPFLGVNYYDGTVHERITTTVAQGAAVRINQQQVRDKHLMNPVIEVARPALRQQWTEVLPPRFSPLSVQEWLGLRQTNLRMRRAKDMARLLKDFTSGRTSLKVRIKVPAPNLKVALNWGDYHFGLALADALRQRGHSCEVDCIDEWKNNSSISDVILVLRGLSSYEPRPEHLNLVWLISHPDKVSDGELERYDHVLVASDIYATLLKKRLMTSVSILHQAVDPTVFRPEYAQLPKSNSIVFVGNSRNVYRKIVRDALELSIPIEVWGQHWSQFIDVKYLKGDHIDNKDLGKTYAHAGILLNDHWEDMKKFGFISNRLFDAIACGSRVISDEIPGIDTIFEGAVTTYSSKEDLSNKVKVLLSKDPMSPHQRAQIAKNVASRHSFSQRAHDLEQIISWLFKTYQNESSHLKQRDNIGNDSTVSN